MKRVHVAVLAACVLCLSAAGPVCAQPRRTDRELEDEGLARTKQADDLKGPVRALRVEKASVYRVGGKYAERRRRVVETGAYDSSGRKTEITYHGEGGELTARTAYAYADEGRRVTSTYFDAAGQLTGTSTE
ncbi:MAG TPA: hypothetical protein VGV38_17610, partial [Pyrinomonadaceae bacterium]|nr:hypothetical protein [Pyrinomonadaceae bacterium]